MSDVDTLTAAQQAEADTRWDEAARLYEEYLSSAGEQAPDEADVLTRLGACYWNLSEARTAWRTLRRAMSLYRDRGDGIGLARATVEIMRIWGPYERQRAMAHEALTMLSDSDPYLRARLLMATSWRGRDDGFVEALALAEKHGFEDVLTARLQDQSWQAHNEGRVEDGIALQEQAYEAYARMKAYDPACGTLRGAGFATLEAGYLDRGSELAQRALDYARSVHLRFSEQLALMDLAGVAFARCEFDRCRELLAQAPTETDFRGDLFRMWMAERAGDTRAAMSLMVDPSRGGGSTNAQTHAAAAGVLFHAGNTEAARQQLDEWAQLARDDDGFFAQEVAGLFDCLVALGDDALVQEIYDSFGPKPDRPRVPVYGVLQGSSLAPARGAICVRLGKLDEAEQLYTEGLAWCESERVPVDAALCHRGLAELARHRGDSTAARSHLERAAAILRQHNIKLYLDDVVSKLETAVLTAES